MFDPRAPNIFFENARCRLGRPSGGSILDSRRAVHAGAEAFFLTHNFPSSPPANLEQRDRVNRSGSENEEQGSHLRLLSPLLFGRRPGRQRLPSDQRPRALERPRDTGSQRWVPSSIPPGERRPPERRGLDDSPDQTPARNAGSRTAPLPDAAPLVQRRPPRCAGGTERARSLRARAPLHFPDLPARERKPTRIAKTAGLHLGARAEPPPRRGQPRRPTPEILVVRGRRARHCAADRGLASVSRRVGRGHTQG